MRNILYLFLFFWIGQAVFANERALSERAEITVLTCGVGDELYSLFGHTAIRVNDPMEGIDRVYNYGMFDFSTPNFYGKFVKGDLLYFADYSTYKNFLVGYYYDNRAVYEQVLNLSQEQKQAIWEELNNSLKEENKYYVYKFIDQNCTTKVGDILNHNLSKPLNTDIEGNREEYRTILNTYLKSRYFELLGINLIFGSKVDQKSTSLFLPDKLMKGIAETTIDGKPLVKETFTVLEENKKEENKGVWWNTIWLFSAVVLLLTYLNTFQMVRNAYFILMGVLGVFFFAVGFYSLHSELLSNNTILLCSPLFLVLPFVRRKYIILKIVQMLLFVSLFLYVVLNLSSEKLIVTLPLFFLTVVSLAIDMRSSRSWVMTK